MEEDTEVVVLDDSEAEDALDGKKYALIVGFEDKNPAVRSVSGHPVEIEQGKDMQQPMNGGSMDAQVYHLIPDGHCWSAKFPYSLALKLAGFKLPAEQPVSPHG